MMAEKDPNVKDILIALFNRNEEYHDFKDKAMWLAASVYLAFTVGILVWLFENKFSLPVNPWVLGVFLSLVFAPTFVFIGWQNWEKCKSVRKTERFNCLIKKLGQNNNRELAYKDLVRLTDPGKLPFCYNFFKSGGPGAIILFVVVVFFLAQIAVVVLFGCTGSSFLHRWIL